MGLPFIVLQNGALLKEKDYTWDAITNTFSSDESHLVICSGYVATFITGNFCQFTTPSSCNFKTGFNCFFNTLSKCKFETEEMCTFDTGSGCTFIVGEQCVLVRRDIFEVHILIPGITMISNNDRIPGWANEDTFESQMFDKNL